MCEVQDCSRGPTSPWTTNFLMKLSATDFAQLRDLDHSMETLG